VKGHTLRLGLMAMLGLFVAACSSGARRVDCDKHLVAINPPAPVTPVARTPSPLP
jgi:hypothetical protein